VKCSVDCFFDSELLCEQLLFFPAGSMLFLLRTLLEGCPSPVVQSCIALRLPHVLSLRSLWPVSFLPTCNEGKLQSHQLFCGVGQAHLPTLVLLMVGAQWTLCCRIEGPARPLLVLFQFYHTWLLVWLQCSA
jgi:hypothetical protein